MLYDPSTAPHLKQWLVRTLEPICDAEPGALADYVLALLKHNVPESEMRKELNVQLDEFLEKEGPPFIDTLFTVLRTKSYLPYDNAPAYPSSSTQHPNDVGIPIPLDGLIQNSSSSPGRGQKRSLEYDDHRPVKGPRLGTSGPFSRYSDVQDYRAWEDRSDRSGMGGVNGQRIQTYQPPDRRGVCRDYHKNGYCARGALCKYSHGDDAFVPSQLFPMNGSGPLPFLPMFPNGGLPFAMTGPNAAYDPHEARMDMRPGTGMMDTNGRAHQRPPPMPRARQEHSRSRSIGELPVIQDLTPQDAALLNTSLEPGQSAVQDAHPMQQNEDVNVDMNLDGETTSPSVHDIRGGFEPRGTRGGRGTFTGNVQSFRPGRRTDKTLVVEKIPQDKLSLDAVNGWFKRFGTVTNVAIDVHNAKALVSFSEHQEALAAWKSEDAVFNNRFVKVFWHRPMEGHGQKGARMLAASAPLVASICSRPSVPTNATPLPSPAQAEAPTPVAPAAVPARKPPVPNAASDLAAKQKLLEQQIAEQKSLMLALGTATPEEKKRIMARLRKLGEELQPSTSAARTVQSPSPATGRPASATPQAPDHEQREKERLDKELELHSAASGQESTEELQVRLAKLREEAASLGIMEHSYAPPAPGVYRPYRGRGRGGRGFPRGAGRGGPPRGSMKLDNRPKRLLIKAVQDDAVPAIRSWYEAIGQLESVSAVDGDVVVGFRTRAAAEQALAKGNDIPSVGSVQITWHTAQQPSSGSQASVSEQSDKGTEELIRESLPSPRPQEEETVSSGWGDAGEDGMGF